MELKERQRQGLPSSVKLSLSPLFEASLAAFPYFSPAALEYVKSVPVEYISGISDKKGRILK